MSIELSHVISTGFSFVNEQKKFIKPSSIGYHNTHKTANLLVQIKQTVNSFDLFTMKVNDNETKNEEWKKLTPYLYCSDAVRSIYGSVHQYPSWVGDRYLRVFMLNTEIAEKFLKSDSVYLPKTDYKDISLILKSEYLAGFKYEYVGKQLYELPNSVPQKQVNNLVKVGTQLVQKPMRKIS